mmetsp:Transcript_37082/g.56980  ORF Transcript_37082/g.56980 Transcript_37082/m.56980 type:complete len:248 (-) Transcript_37082:1328-2071(-)
MQAGHHALAKMEEIGRIGVPILTNDEEDRISIITQNVDSLHNKAGSKFVTPLHGTLAEIKCMNCGHKSHRTEFHEELESLNINWMKNALTGEDSSNHDTAASQRPDGDSSFRRDKEEGFYSDVMVPSCPSCGAGFFKPDVVFFGDIVPRDRVARCQAAVDACDGLLCIGSSLAVHSAFRFVRAAAAKGTPICILNVGETRAENEGIPGILKIEAPAGPTLQACAEQLTSVVYGYGNGSEQNYAATVR